MAFLPDKDFDLLADPDLRDGLARTAEPARALAEQFSPGIMRRPGAEQIQIVVNDDGVFLANTAYGAVIEEFGSRNNAPFAPLRRAAQEAGIRFDEAPKPS